MVNIYARVWTKDGYQDLTERELYVIDNEKAHRLDGPAVEFADGTNFWWANGKKHRSDGPAIIWYDGTKEWYVNGKRHRLDGPAYEGADGSKYWYIDGKELPKKEIETWIEENKIVLTTQEGQMAFKLKFI